MHVPPWTLVVGAAASQLQLLSVSPFSLDYSFARSATTFDDDDNEDDDDCRRSLLVERERDRLCRERPDHRRTCLTLDDNSSCASSSRQTDSERVSAGTTETTSTSRIQRKEMSKAISRRQWPLLYFPFLCQRILVHCAARNFAAKCQARAEA